ncbi:hypothetical protein CA606_18410 [Caulobacter vibrioides]|uniref:Uncharacterized protein n=3 Tax=Caulobacter TaxID=75 RepID=A0A290N2H7_CAUVI|nr:hypothetical protein CA606_18410 [Caulobacter vibrioides]
MAGSALQSSKPTANDVPVRRGYKPDGAYNRRDKMNDLTIIKGQIEALAHASAILLGARIRHLTPGEAATACRVFATPLTDPTPADDPARRGVMLDTLGDIAERALMLSRPVG